VEANEMAIATNASLIVWMLEMLGIDFIPFARRSAVWERLIYLEG
jgi:hypothetical protein